MSALPHSPEEKVDAVVDAPAVDPPPVILGRDALLAAAGTSRDELTIDVPGLGKVLVGEISGEERAAIMESQARSLQQEQVDIRGYQKKMLVAGILDPTSPDDARTPLFRDADAEALMKLGAAKIRHLIEEIEKLSGMGMHAFQRAEGNSATTPSASSTSG